MRRNRHPNHPHDPRLDGRDDHRSRPRADRGRSVHLIRGRDSQPVWRSAEARHGGARNRLEIHNFGVLVPLEGKPGDLPGIGFVRIPELTWEHFDDPADVVYVGQQID